LNAVWLFVSLSVNARNFWRE